MHAAHAFGAEDAAATAAAVAAAAAHNAAAVQAATEAMLAAGFGGWDDGGEGDGMDGDDAGHGLHGGAAPGMAAQLALATAHTAGAAASLCALPPASFFASLRVGEGVDALDCIGVSQWRHAVVLDRRSDGQEVLIRWAGWDAKWDEWVHCLRLAPAHSKVLGDTGPEDSADKTAAAVLGEEWLRFHGAGSNSSGAGFDSLADVRIVVEGRPPWSILDRDTTRGQREPFAPGSSFSPPPLPPHPRHNRAPMSRHAASATPPHFSAAASLDDDDENDDAHDDRFSLSRATAAASSSSASAAAASHLALPAHECILRVRCPRIFKFQRDSTAAHAHATAAAAAASAMASAAAATAGAEASPARSSLDSPVSRRDTAMAQQQGSRTAPASSISAASAAASAERRHKQQLFGSTKLPLNKLGQSSRHEHPSIVAASAVHGSIAHPTPSKLAAAATSLRRSTSTSAAATSGSQSARLARQASASGLGSAAKARKSAGSVSVVGAAGTPVSPPALAHSASTPGSAPNSASRRLFAPTASAATKTPPRSRVATGAASAAMSRSRTATPTASAPATPRLRPAGAASPRSGPLADGGALSPSEAASFLPSSRARAGSASASGTASARASQQQPKCTSSRLSVASQKRSQGPAASKAPGATAASTAAAASSPSSRHIDADEALPRSSPSASPSSPRSASVAHDTDSDSDSEDAASSPATATATAKETVLLSSADECPSPSQSQLQAGPSESLFPKAASATASLDQECKEQPPTHALDSESSAQDAAASVPAPVVPLFKLLVLPLSSRRVLRAFVEYVYSDDIVNSMALRHSRRHRQSQRRQDSALDRSDEDGSDDGDDGDDGTADTYASSASGGEDAPRTRPGLSILELLELSCLGSSLHDPRLVALTAQHIHRTLRPGSILDLLTVLERTGALQHRLECGRRRAPDSGLSPHLDGCLAPPRQDHATHPTLHGASRSSFAAAASKPSGASVLPSIAPSPGGAIPLSLLHPDTPSSFLRTGSAALCGPCSRGHDLDLVARLAVEYMNLQYSEIFGPAGAANGNLRRLHALPFRTFSLLVSLRNQGENAGPGAGAAGGAGAAQSSAAGVAGGDLQPPAYAFKSVEEKALFNQAHVHAALVTAGIQPAHVHSLFAQALQQLQQGGGDGASASVGASALVPGSRAHGEVMRLVASPSITLPACSLHRCMRQLYESRSAATCDVKILVEDDSVSVSPRAAAAAGAGGESSRPVVATLWAHRAVLACGSDYFRTLFGANSTASGAAGAGGLELAQTEPDLLGRPGGVSVVRFPCSALTPESVEVVLRYIYYGESRGGIEFGSALRLMQQRATAYFGLRVYEAGATRREGSRVPVAFACDLEKSCIALLHAALNASSVSGGPSPPARECLRLIHSSYLAGEHDLFAKACVLIDFPQLHMLMASAMDRRAERQAQQWQRQRRAADQRDRRRGRGGQGRGERAQRRAPAFSSSPHASAFAWMGGASSSGGNGGNGASCERKDGEPALVCDESLFLSPSAVAADLEHSRRLDGAADAASLGGVDLLDEDDEIADGEEWQSELSDCGSESDALGASGADPSALHLFGSDRDADFAFIAAVIAEKARAVTTAKASSAAR